MAAPGKFRKKRAAPGELSAGAEFAPRIEIIGEKAARAPPGDAAGPCTEFQYFFSFPPRFCARRRGRSGPGALSHAAGLRLI